MTDRLALLTRAAAGDSSAREAAADILLNALARYLRGDAGLELSRLAGLPSPTARTSLRRLRRNYWLARAAGEIGVDQPWPRAVRLSEEVDHFNRAIWPCWKDLAEPPEHASRLRSALFHATRAAGNAALPVNVRHLHRILTDCDFGSAVSDTHQ